MQGIRLFHGAGPLAIANLAQRGFGFIANAAAARVAGAAIFGEYQLCLVTVLTVANYAGLGIGSTTLRFGDTFDRKAWRVLFEWAIVSGVLAAIVALLMGAASTLGGTVGLPRIVQFGAVSAFAIVMYEFTWARLLVRMEYRVLVGLAVATGVASVIGLAWAARHSAEAMIITHGSVLLTACIVALTLRARSEGTPPSNEMSDATLPKMMKFGLAQISTTAGLALASWWVFLQISWHDTSHIGVGAFAVALQIRALCNLIPSLISQQVLPQLSRQMDDHARAQACWKFSVLLGSLAVCGSSVVLMALPMILGIYGPEFVAASTPSVLMIACTIVLTANIGPFMYLTHTATRTAAKISLTASLVLAVTATILVPSFGAVGGGIAWLCAEVLSSLACLFVIWRRGGTDRFAIAWAFSLYGAVALLTASSISRSMSSGAAVGNLLLTALTAVVFACLLWKVRTLRTTG